MPMTIVDVPGGHLFAIDEGSGPPIVLLHAGVADLRAWDAMVEPLLAGGYRVVRFDTRGYGASTTEDVGFSHRADVLAVLDSLGIGRAALVGNSRGGMIAFDTAIESPERVVAVVGVARRPRRVRGGADPRRSQDLRGVHRGRHGGAIRRRRPDRFRDAGLAGRAGSAIGPGLARCSMMRSARWPARSTNPGASVATRSRSIHPPTTAWQSFAARSSPSPGRSTSTDVVQTAQRLEAAAPDARAVVWDDVAHMVGMERPDRLAGTIVDFLAPLERWG